VHQFGSAYKGLYKDARSTEHKIQNMLSGRPRNFSSILSVDIQVFCPREG